uniref:Iron-sulfur cluster assembly enzyme ISCU n=1 Tax=Strongyloides stercoralis TaxID=6248 RepID=A0AAF5D556_STRER
MSSCKNILTSISKTFYQTPKYTQIASYHQKVIDHYENPRNVGSLDAKDPNVGTGIVGAPACGDVMKLQIKVDDNGKIVEAKFKTFGCGSAIASSSLATEWIQGKTTEYASKIKNDEIAKELSLPPVKLHCSSKFRNYFMLLLFLVLAQDAIQAALNDYKKKQEMKNTE